MTAYEFILQFASEHWFITWCALWLVWGAIWLIVVVLSLTCNLVSRFYRTIMVAARGWPPAHLDADGDWRPAPKVETNTETATVGDMSHTTTIRRQPGGIGPDEIDIFHGKTAS